MRTTARSLAYLRKRPGVSHVGLVERWTPSGGNFKGGKRHDLFGFIDIVALDDAPGILAVQSCGTDFRPHLRKIEAEPAASAWLRRGNRLEVHGWRKLKIGPKAVRWTPRIVVAQVTVSEGVAVGVTWTECSS